MHETINKQQAHAVTGNRTSGVFLLPTEKKSPEHEQQVHEHLGRKLAALLALEFQGDYQQPDTASADHTKDVQGDQQQARRYFIPNDTLVADSHVRRLGIYSTTDFFGGMTAHPFMATKAITHPLFKSGDQAPPEWPKKFSLKVSGAVLEGFTVFNLNDVQRAGIQLLRKGPVRVKSVRACAGRGQHLITNSSELTALIAILDENEIACWGIVLEENLRHVNTYSVGQVIIDNLTLTYVGTQSLTRDNEGETVYGGSSLVLARGGYSDLLALQLSDNMRLAISQACTYEEAAMNCIPGLLASRRNYDVAQGFDVQGNFCSGVLEQSWRIGGASGAEIYALEAFARQDTLTSIKASTREIYGTAELPEHTAILYRGKDAEVGLITKLVTVEAYGNANPIH